MTSPSAHWVKHLYAQQWLPLKQRLRWMRYLRQTHLDLTWFEDFRPYWGSVLGGATLWGVEDFYFLKNHYRIAFQGQTVAHDNDPQHHLEAWQAPATLYQLFHAVYKETVIDGIDGSAWIMAQALKHLGHSPRRILEFGAAIGPLAKLFYSLYRPDPALQFYLADLQSLAFHYAGYRFRAYPQVIPHLLTPQEAFIPTLEGAFDLIFCMTVYEHLNQPLAVTQWFHEHLQQGGLLVFDYIKSHASGLDSQQGLNQREAVLDYIRQHFEVLAGRLDKSTNMGLTIARKR